MMNFLSIVTLALLSTLAFAQDDAVAVLGGNCVEDFESGTEGAPLANLFPGLSIFGSPRPATLFDASSGVGEMGLQPQEGLVVVLNKARKIGKKVIPYVRPGTITFQWDEPTSIISVGLLDVEETGSLMIFSEVGTILYTGTIGGGNNGGLYRVDVNVEGAKKMLIMTGGSLAVTDIVYCEDPPVVTGDPHFKTWGHKWVDYHGQCDLVMLHATNFDGLGHDLDIHVRTTISFGYSFIESAAVKIGNDIVEVAGNGWFAVNGVETPYLGGHAGHIANNHYRLFQSEKGRKRDTFDIVLNEHVNITLSSFKDLVSVALTGGSNSSSYYGDSVGILGSFQGELYARDGKTRMQDMNVHGQEWQVTDTEPKLFMSDRAPQFPAKCILPTAETANLRRLGGREQQIVAVRACEGVTGYKHNDCVQEVRAAGDVSLAQKYRN